MTVERIHVLAMQLVSYAAETISRSAKPARGPEKPWSGRTTFAPRSATHSE